MATGCVALILGACHEIENFGQGNKADFEALWTIIDEHYCFFDQKGVDWQAIHDKYEPMVTNGINRKQLFSVCSMMINELCDGHTNLSSGFETSYYRNWWSDFPQNYDKRLIQQYYFNFNYKQLGAVTYGILRENVGYIHIASFSNGLSNGNIDNILNDLIRTNGLVIDLRDNGGGDMSSAENWARHFLLKRTLIGYMSHKTGPGHNDFDKPYPIYFDPLGATGTTWVKPVILLTNRSTFSAANYLVMAMKDLPQVTHAGATTGGGAGIPYSQELPGGWTIRMSAVRVTDAQGISTEGGIAPEQQNQVNLDPTVALNGHDTMLDFAISLIK